MDQKDKLFIVMPAYNEETNIESVIKEWYPVLQYGNEASRLIIDDTGSEDETSSIIKKMAKDHPKLETIAGHGSGHGVKLINLYRYSIQNGADWIFQTDSDGQTDPDEFERFWKLRTKYCGIFGNRVKRADGVYRRFIEKILRIYVWIFFKASVPDANAPFRLMRADVLKKYLVFLPEDFNLPNAFLTACFSRFGEKIRFCSITFQARRSGRNHMNLKRIVMTGLLAARDFRYLGKVMDKYEEKIAV